MHNGWDTVMPESQKRQEVITDFLPDIVCLIILSVSIRRQNRSGIRQLQRWSP